MRTDVRRGTEGPGSSLGSPALGGAFVMTVLLLIGVVAVASRAPIGASGVGRASIARAAGETAPLLFVDSLYNPSQTQLDLFGHGVPNIPIYIWTTYDLPTANAITNVWGAALVLLTFILLANVAARVLLARTRAKMRG